MSRDLVFKIPLIRYFVLLRLAKDKRANSDLNKISVEKRKYLKFWEYYFMLCLVLGFVLSFLVGLFIILYALKSVAGINVFDGVHPLREVLSWFNICP